MNESPIKMRVGVTVEYLEDKSSPDSHRFLWAYGIIIYNDSDEIVQLLNRHWKITDMRGKVEEVHGPGVTGLQPIIKPGKSFAYTSFSQLTTPQGTMEGHYEMQTLNDVLFNVEIPKFILSCPSSTTSVFRSHLH